MPVLENYRLRFDVEGAEKAERAFRRTAQTVQDSLKKATDPTASGRNLHMLERNLEGAERDLAKMRQALQPIPGGLRLVDRGARAASGGLAALSGTVPGLAAVSGVLMGPVGIVAAIGALGAVAGRAIPRAMAEISSMADTAERVGVSAEYFQELQGAMLLMTEDATALTPALQRLLEVTGQAALGIGEGATAFRDMGLDARNAEGEVKSLEELLPEIAEKMQAAGTQAERLAIAQRLFGEQGRAFVRVLEQGSDGLDTLAARSREAGIVMEEGLVEQAREADAQLKLASERMGVAADKILIALEPALTFGIEAFADFVSGVADAVTELGRFDDALDALAGAGAVTDSVVTSTGKMIEELEDRLASGIGSERYRQGLRDLIAMRREQLAFMQLQMLPDAPPISGASPVTFSVSGSAPPPVARSSAPSGRSVRPAARPSSPEAAPSLGDLRQWRAEFEDLGQAGEDSALQIDRAYIDAFSGMQRAMELLGVESDSTFGRIVGGTMESLQTANQLLQTVQALGAAMGAAGGGSGGGAGGLFSSLVSGGLGLLSAAGSPGNAAGIGAALGVTTGSFGGATALAGGASAASSLGMFGFAQGGEFTVGGSGGVDRQVVQFLATPGETVRIDPPGEMRGGGGSGPVNVSVRVMNTAPGVTVEPQERRRPDGGVEIGLLVRQVKEDLANDVRERRGVFSHALRDEFASRGG